MPPGLDRLAHIVVLMMKNRSFDHMLGSLKAVNSQIDGITDQLRNPDTTERSDQAGGISRVSGTA